MGSSKHAPRPTRGPGVIGANGDIRQDWRRLNGSDVIASADPAAHLNSFTDLGPGSGLQINLGGSWGSSDWAGVYPYWVFRLPDYNARWFRQSTPLSPALLTRIRTSPGDSSDYAIYFVVVNETDLTTGTIDGKGMGMIFQTATRTLVSTRVSNGVVTSPTGGAATTNASFTTSIPLHGTDRICPLQDPVVVGLSSTDAYNSTAIAHGATGTLLGSGDLYLAIAAGRVSAGNAASATGAFDFYITSMFPSVYPP